MRTVRTALGFVGLVGLATAAIVFAACVGDDSAASTAGRGQPDGGDGDATTTETGTTRRGGIIDPSFSGMKDVRVETLAGVAADATGRVYVLGQRRRCRANGVTDVVVARISETGAVDAAYGTDARA